MLRTLLIAYNQWSHTFWNPLQCTFDLLLCTCVDIVDLHINLYRPLSEHLVSMVLSYWRSSAEHEDLFSTFTRVTWKHCTVTLGIVVKCVYATTLPDLQGSALDLQWYHGNRMLRKGSISSTSFLCTFTPDRQMSTFSASFTEASVQRSQTLCSWKKNAIKVMAAHPHGI